MTISSVISIKNSATMAIRYQLFSKCVGENTPSRTLTNPIKENKYVLQQENCFQIMDLKK